MDRRVTAASTVSAVKLVRRLRKTGTHVSEIANRLGCGLSYVERLIVAARAPDGILDLARDGVVSINLIFNAYARFPPEAAETAIREISAMVGQKATLRDLHKYEQRKPVEPRHDRVKTLALTLAHELAVSQALNLLAKEPIKPKKSGGYVVRVSGKAVKSMIALAEMDDSETLRSRL